MNEYKNIVINEDFDIVAARMQVRDLARATGFNLVGQACIALAASSSARVLGLGDTQPGQITVDCLQTGDRIGVRVVCQKHQATVSAPTPEAFRDTRRMVDELTIETLPPNEVQVTLVKWLQ